MSISLVESPYDMIDCAHCGEKHLRVRCPKRVRDAAEDLLRACKANLDTFDMWAPVREANAPGKNRVDPHFIAITRAAVAKAEGREDEGPKAA
jgi:hypothetical protein